MKIFVFTNNYDGMKWTRDPKKVEEYIVELLAEECYFNVELPSKCINMTIEFNSITDTTRDEILRIIVKDIMNDIDGLDEFDIVIAEELS